MFYSSDSIDIDLKDCFRKNFSVYLSEAHYYDPLIGPKIIGDEDGKKVKFEEIMSCESYRQRVNNYTLASLLLNSKIEKNELCDNSGDFDVLWYPYSLEDTEFENIKSGKTLLRVNSEEKIIYTVSRSDDWYIFKSFFPVKGNLGNKEDRTKLSLTSVWCVKEVPNLKDFNNIIKGITTISDIKNIDPSFRYLKRNDLYYSTHTFADKKGSRITIEYKKDSMGICRVSDVIRVTDGRNILPYLLPIDRKLIDPNYKETPDEVKESKCNIL